MSYLYLTIPYHTFVKQMEDYKVSLQSLLTEPLQGHYTEIFKDIQDFLKSSFNIEENNILEIFNDANPQIYSNEHYNVTRTINDKVTAKINGINEIIQTISLVDLIKQQDDALFYKRQRLTMKQKRNFVLLELSKMNRNLHHSLELLYKLNGLKIESYQEIFDVSKKLKDEGYVNSTGGERGDYFIQIKNQGVEYVQDLNEEAFGLFKEGEELSYKEKTDLSKAFRDLEDNLKNDLDARFKEQQEVLILAMKSLHEVIDESLIAIDSKLPKDSIRQLIKGVILEKTTEKGLQILGVLIWKALGDKIFLPDALSHVNKVIDEFK